MNLRGAFETPWKITNGILRYLIEPFVRINFAWNQIPWQPGWRFYGMPIIQKHRRSTIEIGPGLSLRSSVRSNPLGLHHPVILCTWGENACLRIGEYFSMSGGSITAVQQIVIGNRVAVGANTTIVDTDFHPLEYTRRIENSSEGLSAPIEIGDDVFIGMNCLILKGVRIGSGSVIGAGSVVTRDIPPGVIAAGNPAKVIREILT